jgi:hypothetical protein
LTPLGGRATKMGTRRRSIEAVDGAPMGRWFRAQGGGIGVGLGAVDNGGCSRRAFYRAIGRRKVGSQGKGGNIGGILMVPVTGD